jgi:GGDEF domain-containing protein
MLTAIWCIGLPMPPTTAGSGYARPFHVEGRAQAMSTSIGVAFTGSGGIGMQALSRKADEALDEVKRAGRGHYHLLVAGN